MREQRFAGGTRSEFRPCRTRMEVGDTGDVGGGSIGGLTGEWPQRTMKVARRSAALAACHPQGEALHVGAGSCRKCSGLPCGGHAASAALRHATHKRIATNSCSESMMDNPQGQELPVSTRQGGPGQLGSPQIRYYRLDDRLLRRGSATPCWQRQAADRDRLAYGPGTLSFHSPGHQGPHDSSCTATGLCHSPAFSPSAVDAHDAAHQANRGHGLSD